MYVHDCDSFSCFPALSVLNECRSSSVTDIHLYPLNATDDYNNSLKDCQHIPGWLWILCSRDLAMWQRRNRRSSFNLWTDLTIFQSLLDRKQFLSPFFGGDIVSCWLLFLSRQLIFLWLCLSCSLSESC